MEKTFHSIKKAGTMNILFLIFHGFDTSNGISNKIKYQIQGLKANGHQVFLCYYDILPNGHRSRIIDSEILEDYGSNLLAALKKRICYQSIYHFILQNKIQFVYIRSFHNANPFTIHFYHQLRKKNIKAVMEIPTYPYDNEYQNVPFYWHIELLMDKIFRKKMAHELEAIVTFTDEAKIFGQKTIQISNGIDFDAIPLKQNRNDTSKEIHLIAVAEVHYWHGFDRLINGLGLYYQTNFQQRVFFHIVGGMNKNEKNTFLQCIHNNQVEKYVILHGPKHGEELNSVFEKCDFAIGSLARHRVGIDKIKTLKNREYAARGIPFIYSETDTDFDQMPYVLKVPADESPLDIKEIINFFHIQKMTPLEIRNSIEHLSWDKQMQKVITTVFDKNKLS